MKTYIFAALVLLLALVAACSGNQTSTVQIATVPPPTTDPLRQELERGKAKTITFPCENGVEVSVDVVFNGMIRPGFADVNGLEVKTGHILHVQPQEGCDRQFYTVGWIEVQGQKVFLHLVPPTPFKAPFLTPAPTESADSFSGEPMRAQIDGYEIIIAAIEQTIEQVSAEPGAKDYTINRGPKKCFKVGEKYPILFDIEDATLPGGLHVYGAVEGQIFDGGETSQLYGVFVRYPQTGRWGFLPVFYYTGEKQGDCFYIQSLTLSGPTSTIPSDPPQ